MIRSINYLKKHTPFRQLSIFVNNKFAFKIMNWRRSTNANQHWSPTNNIIKCRDKSRFKLHDYYLFNKWRYVLNINSFRDAGFPTFATILYGVHASIVNNNNTKSEIRPFCLRTKNGPGRCQSKKFGKKILCLVLLPNHDQGQHELWCNYNYPYAN